MPQFLSKRNPGLVEWMDRPDCDRTLLFNTYQQFSRINRLLSGWKSIYKTYLRPVIAEKNGKASILDIGCGGGDVLRLLEIFCRKDGFDVRFTGIDPDQRSLEYLSDLEWPENVKFEPLFSHQLVKENRKYDIVISNHVMHHLLESELSKVCSDAEKLAGTLVLFSDIERSDMGYALFSTIAPLLFQNSYIVQDGLISIKRSFRKKELDDLLSDQWIVKRRFPFRLLAIYRNKETDG
jgi:2-polyprenyl-3-methyl-5-hydroxy-6-metoxy-1,4-benzoquinol methylase